MTIVIKMTKNWQKCHVPWRRCVTAIMRCETSFFVCVGGQYHVTLMTPPPTSNTLNSGTDNA